MFHAPTSENKQQNDSGRTRLAADEGVELSPHTPAISGQWSGAVGGAAPPASPGIGPQQEFARLHRMYGNQAVLRTLSRSTPPIQTKLTVNQPGDRFEQEADRVADQVMRMTAAPAVQRSFSSCNEDKLQRKRTECEEEEKKSELHRKETNPGPQFAPPSVHDVLNSPGQPLDPATRAFMEPRFGQDFSAVRVHTNEPAANSARDVNALAYTTGNNIVFGPAQYSPSSASGRRLLAHELTHVLQQSSVNTTPAVQRQNPPTEGDEPAADTATSITEMLRNAAGRATSAVSAVGTSLASLLPSLPPPCHAATSLLMARTLHAFVSGSFIPFARGMFGPQTASLWAEYLDTSLGLPRPARAFAGSGEIVNGFTTHHKSAEAEQEIINASVVALGGPAASSMPAPGSTNTVPVTTLVPAATLLTRIKTPPDPMALDYDSPATTIPGNIAGGIGSGGPPGNTVSDPDTRGVDGAMQLTLDASGTNLTVTPLLTFQVHDTVDFCPGALGGLLARVETVPMSILEATEGTFGPIFAADVPYDVSYPGPGVSKTVAAPPPPPAPPPTPTPPTPPPSPTPPSPGPAPSPAPVPPSQGVTPSAPSDLPCQVSTDFGITGDKVKFRVGNATISTSAQTAAIRGFVSRWQHAGSSDDVRVDGYASVDGPNDLNWRLSCRRALSVAGALSSDIPSGKINTRAHGPTDEFSPSDPTEDRVAVISSTVSPAPPGPAPPGPTPPGPVPPGPVPPTPPGPPASGGVTLKDLTFLSDHHFMKDNRADFDNTGTLFPKPQWEPTNAGSRSAPISQNKDSNVVVQLTLDAATGNPAGVPFTLIGQSSEGFLTFKASGTLQDGPNQIIVLNSVSTTKDEIKAFPGQAINWSIQLPSGRQPLGTVQGLDVFVTMAPPRLPNEVTYKRMAKAVELTGAIHTLDPQELVQGIMRKFGAYNLDVQYDNAWNMANNIALGAQCIDIVRFVMGLIQTVGCPGVAEAKLIWAKPTDPATAVETDYVGGHSLHDFPPHPSHPTWGAALIDANACPNNFEAALKFTFGDTRYYPGGVPLIDAGGRKIIFSSAQQVLEIFQYLAWIEDTGINKKWTAQEFLISYSHRRTDKVPFTLVCDSKVLP